MCYRRRNLLLTEIFLNLNLQELKYLDSCKDVVDSLPAFWSRLEIQPCCNENGSIFNALAFWQCLLRLHKLSEIAASDAGRKRQLPKPITPDDSTPHKNRRVRQAPHRYGLPQPEPAGPCDAVVKLQNYSFCFSVD